MGAKWRIGNRTYLAAVLGLLAIAVLVALFMGASAQGTFKGSERCEECHPDQYTSWQNTWHGLDFTNWYYASQDKHINKLTYSGGNDTTGMTGSCAPCHVVGYKQLDKDGFDPAKPWNDTDNMKLLSIGCENCHGPSSAHPGTEKKLNTGEYAQVTSCAGTEFASCHAGRRQYGNETIHGWNESAHANEAPASAQSRLSCANCRATEGFIAVLEGSPLTALPEEGLTWKITCLACHDPHPDEGDEHEYQLRADPEEICEKCHYSTSSWPGTNPHHPQTEMRKGQKGQDVTSTSWMDEVSCPECHMWGSPSSRDVPYYQSHSWEPRPQGCMECHSMWEDVEEVEEYIEGMEAKTEAKLAAMEPYLNDLNALKKWAQGNESTKGALWTDALNTSYNKAFWNTNLVINDKSGGMHNPQYTWAMLDAAMENAGAVKDALNIGGVSGKVEYAAVGTDPAEPIANATIKDGNGNQVAKTGTDGSYFFWAPAMTKLYVIELDGKAIGTISTSGQSMQNKTVGTTTIEKAAPPTGDGDGDDEDEPMLNTLSIVLIVVIIVLIILMAVMSMKKKPSA